MKNNENNRVVFVTGSSRGIGLGIAKAFVANGDTVILNGCKDKNKLVQAVEELKELQIEYKDDIKQFCKKSNDNHEKIGSIFADLSDYQTAKKTFEQIKSEFGCIDILVNNAGVAHVGLFTDMTPEEMQLILATNLQTALNSSHLAIPPMVHKKRGCIINVTSVWGIAGASCEVVYSVAKAGVIGLTKALAKELAPSGIRINAIACGVFDTRMNEHLNSHEKNALMEEIPLGRFGHPNEVGDVATFLASESASYLTGQTIVLDGGFL